MADAVDSKSTARKGIGVQVPSPAPAFAAVGCEATAWHASYASASKQVTALGTPTVVETQAMQIRGNRNLSEPAPMRLMCLNWAASARWCLTIAFWLIVNIFLFMPSRNLPDVQWLPLQDKIIHLIIFALLAAMVRWSMPLIWGAGWRGSVLLISLVAYGACTEWMQYLLPDANRAFEWLDIFMDALGAAAGLSLCGHAMARQ